MCPKHRVGSLFAFGGFARASTIHGNSGAWRGTKAHNILKRCTYYLSLWLLELACVQQHIIWVAGQSGARVYPVEQGVGWRSCPGRVAWSPQATGAVPHNN